MSEIEPEDEHQTQLPVELERITPVCFEIAGAGRGWNVLLGNVPSWYGRGPSGVLLGPYCSENKCAIEVAADIAEHYPDNPRVWVPTTRNRQEDLTSSATPEERYSNEPTVLVWVVFIPGENPFHVFSTEDGVIEGARIEDPVEAANWAISEAARLRMAL